MGSFAALIDRLIAAQTQLISSYLRIGSSVARPSRVSAAATPDPATAVSTDAIEARAYEIFLRRAGRPGNPVDDWRRAEAELRGEITA